jgi:uncharacterized membrane protein
LRHVQQLSSVPPAIDTVIASAFETERLTIADAVRSARVAQEDAAAIVRRDPMNLDSLDEALTRIRTGDDAALTAMHHALRSAAAKLDPQSREVIADVLETAPPAGNGLTQRYRWASLRRLLY